MLFIKKLLNKSKKEKQFINSFDISNLNKKRTINILKNNSINVLSIHYSQPHSILYIKEKDIFKTVYNARVSPAEYSFEELKEKFFSGFWKIKIIPDSENQNSYFNF